MTLAEITRLEPGLYPDVPEEIYHSDPAVKPSLSGSVAKIFMEHAPRHVWEAHPRLNPRWTLQPGKVRTDIGSVCHKLLFGVGKAYEVLDYPDFKTNVAKAARDACYRKGIVPILREKYEPLLPMVESFHKQAAGSEHADAFAPGGQAEVTFIADDRGASLRCRTDWLPVAVLDGGHVKVYDYKTTERSANPNEWQRILFEKRMDIQAAMNERCIRANIPGIKTFEFIYMVQEWKAPWQVSWVGLGGEALSMAHEACAAAIEAWDSCLKANQWPGYPNRTVRVDPASWRKSAHVLRKMELYDLINRLQEPDEIVDQKTGEIDTRPRDAFGLLTLEQARLSSPADDPADGPEDGKHPADALIKSDPTPAAGDGAALAGVKFMLDPAPPPDIKTRPAIREAEVPEGDEDGEL